MCYTVDFGVIQASECLVLQTLLYVGHSSQGRWIHHDIASLPGETDHFIL